MRIPVVRGMIERRILVNFRVDPGVLAKVLPARFRPKLMDGFGMAGICLIRLKHLRPRGLPGVLGIGSENAAHRIAVEWDDGDTVRDGVFVLRRDTSSRFNVLAGGRLFPGVHYHARFDCREDGRDYQVRLNSDDRQTRVAVRGRVTAGWPPGSVFASLAEASEFFQAGSLGYSPGTRPGRFDGLELRSMHWTMEALDVNSVESSWFEDRALFPRGSVEFDSALLMRDIDHEWHAREVLCDCAEDVTVSLTGCAAGTGAGNGE